MLNLEEMGDAVINGEAEKIKNMTNKAIEEGSEPRDIINKGLIKGMNIVGRRFKAGDMYVPEVMMAAKAMNAGMEIVKPLLVEGDISAPGKVVLGTVTGDLHDIGKNLVGMLMESGGLKVTDLGTDVEPEKFAEAVQEQKPDILGMSALLTTTMLAMQDTIEVLQEEGLRDSVKIIVGGAPVTQDFADEIGADGWAADAATAKDLALEMINNE